MSDALLGLTVGVVQIGGLVILGLIFRVDRKRRGKR